MDQVFSVTNFLIPVTALGMATASWGSNRQAYSLPKKGLNSYFRTGHVNTILQSRRDSEPGLVFFL